ncbi:MAG: FAD:protein FMN transferase [Blastocatellia bacterium]|nr:FAD:protein FMN transferase [Blastocatellia bacterium]
MKEWNRSWDAMGGRFEVILRGEDEEHLEAVGVAVMEEVERLDRGLSRFDGGSEVARVNREAVERPVRVDRELYALLERCELGRRETEGFFDAAMSGELELDGERCTVRLAGEGVTLDLGAIGKGYALDCGREIAERYGVASGLLQGGTSSVLAFGEEAWPIDLRDPLVAEAVTGRIELRDRGLSCSAVRHAGQATSDLVDPHTGAPITGSDACIVLAKSATTAEIFSTGLLAMGRERAAKFLSSAARLDLTVGWIASDAGLFWFD